MSPSAGEHCAIHADRPASFTCARCGDFGCDACARRVVPAAMPLCDACWRARELHVIPMSRAERPHRALVIVGVGIAIGLFVAGLVLSLSQ